MSDINTPDQDGEEPANLKFLRRLVTTLTATMIIGLVVMIALVVIRLQQPPVPLALPDNITLPQGAKAQAVTYGRDWYAVVSEDDVIYIFDRSTNALRQIIPVE